MKNIIIFLLSLPLLVALIGAYIDYQREGFEWWMLWVNLILISLIVLVIDVYRSEHRRDLWASLFFLGLSIFGVWDLSNLIMSGIFIPDLSCTSRCLFTNIENLSYEYIGIAGPIILKTALYSCVFSICVMFLFAYRKNKHNKLRQAGR